MQPEFRVTIRRDGIVRLVTWHDGLVVWGPQANRLGERSRAGVAIADLTVERDDLFEEDWLTPVTELIVDPVTAWPDAADAALCEWAALIGYSRVWLPGSVRDLAATSGGQVTTVCTGCRSRQSDGHPEFWSMVRRRGCFPSVCCVCGSDVPQWTRVPSSVAVPPAPTYHPSRFPAHDRA
ncbi:hypothetical protein DSM112329_04780 [Paraconexibacter sp. AEG42_29]|uniref:Uncharacterized protein n=1 Tax=Paraconexibacter sp. AEG42_29 TaxID=2997339 RepID=A0AAU7B1S5_9ACTN